MINHQGKVVAISYGLSAALALLLLYTGVVSGVSGWVSMVQQFSSTWYFLISLALGFGLQVGLYIYIKHSYSQGLNGKMVATSGTTSTVAMLACCSHYVLSIAPYLGAVGIFGFLGQYQRELYWFGLFANLLGITYLFYKLRKLTLSYVRHEPRT